MNETRGPIRAALIGVWTLRQYSDITEGQPSRHPFGPNPEGLLIYTADGFVSALLMAPDRPSFGGEGLQDATPDQYTVAGRGFIGYSGVYEVDEALEFVMHRPLVAFAPNMIGSEQKRLVELNGDTLVLTAEHARHAGSPVVTSSLEWFRVKSVQPEAER